jgi:putative tryptophan/tyrosine transport system substrate-binding protein
MRRRDFIAGLGIAASWPVLVQAQQTTPIRHIGVLSALSEHDPQQRSYITAFQQELGKLGWTDGGNIQIDYRWGDANIERIRAFAADLVALHPDVLFVGGTPALAALRQATRSIPIVFTQVADPIGMGFVASLARPGGNITGFLIEEPPLAGKRVQLLKLMVPRLRRMAYLFDPDVAASPGDYFRYAEAAAAPLMVEMIAAAVRDDSELEEKLAALAREPNSGMLVLADPFTVGHRKQIIELAARHRLPAMWNDRDLSADGGLISYGIDFRDRFRQAAGYVDRILRGAKPADLPVQAPERYDLVINLKTARAMELDVSAGILSLANEVIE